MNKQVAIAIAMAVGGLFATSVVAADSAEPASEAVKCIGGNACKGQSACTTATNACKGKNSCKGTGMIMTATEKECTDKGGKLEKSE